MLKSEKKKIVFKRLDAELKPLGWKRICDSGHLPVYVFENSLYKVCFRTQFGRETVDLFTIELAIKEVESYISECIGGTVWIPGSEIIIDNKTKFRTTVKDRYDLSKCYNYLSLWSS